MIFDLPTKLDINGKTFDVRFDYRVILETFSALNDPELTDADKAMAVLMMFYPRFDDLLYEDYQEAINQYFWFVNCGEKEENKKTPKLIDWEQDFKYIVAPINRVYGTDIRSIKYDDESNTGGLHWWTFMSCYYEIGDCLFAQIVRIRNAKAKGKALDKTDKEWYRQNRNLVDFKSKYSSAEDEILKQWT